MSQTDKDTKQKTINLIHKKCGKSITKKNCICNYVKESI